MPASHAAVSRIICITGSVKAVIHRDANLIFVRGRAKGNKITAIIKIPKVVSRSRNSIVIVLQIRGEHRVGAEFQPDFQHIIFHSPRAGAEHTGQQQAKKNRQIFLFHWNTLPYLTV